MPDKTSQLIVLVEKIGAQKFEFSRGPGRHELRNDYSAGSFVIAVAKLLTTEKLNIREVIAYLGTNNKRFIAMPTEI
ncbi:MAG: hypothetical protein V4649_08980 [Bacteroidota bacterium]